MPADPRAAPVISAMLAVPDASAAAGADATIDPVRDHQMPWGTHRQGGFLDPFGHTWLVGDCSPLARHEPG